MAAGEVGAAEEEWTALAEAPVAAPAVLADLAVAAGVRLVEEGDPAGVVGAALVAEVVASAEGVAELAAGPAIALR